MKTILCLLLVLALLSAFGLSPFSGREAQELNPAQTLIANFSEAGVRLTTENGQSGFGATWDEAVQNLKNSSVGAAFLQTAERIVVCGAQWMDLAAVALSDALRPAAQVYAGQQVEDAAAAQEYLDTRPSAVTVGELKTAIAQKQALPSLPEVRDENGTLIYAD